jgi:hypothetical protein
MQKSGKGGHKMSDKFYMSDNSVVSAGLFESNLLDYLNYSLYIENVNQSDEPIEGNFLLYDVFDDAISCLNQEGEITISEKISSKVQILSTNNYSEITAIFGEVTPEIDYDGINALISQIDDEQTFEEISAKIYAWLGKFVNLTINRNPENADETNLILVQSLLKEDSTGKCYVQTITEALLNKIFRNLIQLIRVKHEWRLYGKGTTILGGKATELSSKTKLGEWSSTNPSCWTQFAGNYIVGKSAYGVDLPSISSKISGTFAINPSTCYGIAPHTHSVSISEASVPTTVSAIEGRSTFGVIKKFVNAPNPYMVWVKLLTSGPDLDSRCTPWDKEANRILVDDNPQGFADPTGICAAIVGGGSWEYSWSSTNCKLNATSNMMSEIFTTKNTILPTYATYIWKWTGEDDTNITSPTEHIT